MTEQDIKTNIGDEKDKKEKKSWKKSMASGVVAGFGDAWRNFRADAANTGGYRESFKAGVMGSPEVQEVIRETTTEYVVGAIQEVTEEVRTNSAQHIANIADQVALPTLNLYETLRDSIIAPNDGVFTKLGKSIVAKVATWAIKIGSFITAKYIDTWAGTNNCEQNSQNLQRIAGGMVAMAPGT